MSVIDEAAPATHSTANWQPPPSTEAAPVLPWTYAESDPGLMLFTAAVERFRMTFPPGSRILELGCAETDWLERMAALDRSYDLVGVDARRHERKDGSTVRILEGSAMDPDLFPENSFDRIVLLGALEHFGLGFYGDPVDDDGDRRAMQNVARWLRPGGFVYFDVPCQPAFRIAANRHYRMYAARHVANRLLMPWTGVLQEINRAYSLPEPHAGTWCHEPTVERVPYWYVAVLAQKVRDAR